MTTQNTTTFNWAAYPTNEVEFEALMLAIDSSLSLKGLKPFQRPLHIGFLLWEAFSWEGQVLPQKELVNQSCYTGDTLMAKAHRWYEQMYGEKLKSDWSIGYIPVKIANGLWKVRLPVIYGSCNFFIDKNLSNKGRTGIQKSGLPSINLLCLVDDLPSGLVERLPESEIMKFFDIFVLSYDALSWRERLKGHVFFEEACNDYSTSTDELLKNHFSQSRWASAQAIEKTLKGLLDLRSIPYPRGSDGHDLVKLGELIKTKLNIDIDTSILAIAKCSPKVRYGEEASNLEQTLVANYAVLELLDQLSKSLEVERIFTSKD